MRIGILTGGGDAPGLNGIIEATSKALLAQSHEVVGIYDGFEGIFENRTKVIVESDLRGIHAQAGTYLGTTNKCGTAEREEEFLQKYRQLNLDGLVVAGGDGTFAGLRAFKNDIKIIGVPKTIDNDLPATEFSFGYDTACSVVAEAVDSLRATANAHKRLIIVETMGRTTGWLALGGGLASYADVILIPERPFQKLDLLQYLQQKRAGGNRGLVLVVAEGAHAQGEDVRVAFKVEGSPEPIRLGGIAENLARYLQEQLKWEARHVVLGHLQRSRAPTTADRFLTMAMGVEVAKMIQQNDWNKAAVFVQGRVQRVPVTDLMQPPKRVEPDHRWVHMARALQIFI